MTCDTWPGGEYSIKLQVPSSYGWGLKVFEDIFTNGDSLNYLIVEQPWLHRKILMLVHEI